jgi:L-xylulokinase
MFEHRRHIDVLRAADVPFNRAALSGGGARSPIWPQMFADGLGVPVTVAEAQETGALGAAIGAGVGVGVFEDYEAGIAKMTRIKASCAPNPKMQEHYNSRYTRYLQVTEAMQPLWNAP